MKTAMLKVVGALLSLSMAASVMAQIAFQKPRYDPPFQNDRKLEPGGRAAFGDAMAKKFEASDESSASGLTEACNSFSQAAQQNCGGYSQGNVTLAKGSANFAPIVVVIKKE